ncbi:MAG: lysophospholipid acyltransferase family protein [Candidatus Brocadiia bacterium]
MLEVRKQLQKAIHWLEYAVVRNVVGALTALPWRAGRRVARVMGTIYHLVDRRRRRRNALENLRDAYPEAGEEELRRLLKEVYRHLAATVLDGFYFARFIGKWPEHRLFQTHGFEKLNGTPNGTGVVFVTGHLGQWEILGAAASLLGYPVWSVGRPFDNEYLEQWLQRLRGITGQQMLPKHGFLRYMIRLVERGENVALLIDQDARRHGRFVEFFGRPASTTTAAARIAIRTGAPVAFVYGRRIDEQNRFNIVLDDVVWPQEGRDRDAEVHRITQRLTTDLERVVRSHPEEWLWLHRRWKTYPGKYEDS